MKTSQAGLEFLASWEGCRLAPYRDVAGLWTVGVGHLIKPGEHFSELTREQAFALLASDLASVERALATFIKVDLTQHQHDAVASFAFNVGNGAAMGSGVVKAINAGDFKSVPRLLLQWCHARINGVSTVVRGLYLRRVAEGELFATPMEDPRPMHEHDTLDEEERETAQAAIAMSLDRSIRGWFDRKDEE